MTVRILHFADAHIDAAMGGKRDAASGFSIRTLDFLKAFDTIIDTAIAEKVDLVLFAGDAYRDATPSPTFQREWDRRMMRLSEARIPTLMIPGNHDITPASTKANALQEFASLDIPYLHLAGEKPKLWRPEDLDNVPIQVITVPWITRSKLVLKALSAETTPEEVLGSLEDSLQDWIGALLDEADPAYPTVILAHYSVFGAQFPNQQMVTLGSEITLPVALLKDPRVTYTALGHIHLFQDLNQGNQPPVVYPGSIERVNFGEAREKKGFILAELRPGHAEYTFRELNGRRFYNREITIRSAETFTDEVLAALPSEAEADGAMVRLVIHYPSDWENALNAREARHRMRNALEFHLVRKPVYTTRQRIYSEAPISSLAPIELLRKYSETMGFDPGEIAELLESAAEIFAESDGLPSGDDSSYGTGN